MKAIFYCLALFCFCLKSGADLYNVIKAEKGTVWVNCKYKQIVLGDYYRGLIAKNVRDQKVEGGLVLEDCSNNFDGLFKLGRGDNTYYLVNLVAGIDNNLDRDLVPGNKHLAPMKENFVNGAWAVTEEIASCSDQGQGLRVMVGSVWDEHSDETFEKSHGIVVPSYFWKVIEKEDNVIAWLFPNSQNATRVRSDKYLISVSSLEKKINIEIPIAEWKKVIKPTANWPVDKSCLEKPRGPHAEPQG